MPIDASIPLQAKGIQLESPVNQLAMLNEATKFGEMNRAIDEQNKLNEYLKSGADLSSVEGRRGLINYGKTGLGYAKALNEQDTSAANLKKTNLEVDEKKLGIMRERSKDLLQNTSNENFIAHTQENVRDGLITPQQGQQAIQNYTNIPPNQRVAFINQNLAKAEEVYKMQETMRHNRTTEGISYGNLAVNQQTLANANNPEIQARLAAARAGGTETGKATAQAAIALPGAIATGEEAIRKVDELVGAAPVKNAEGKLISAGTKPHAGFGQAVGAGIPGLKYIPGTSVTDFNKRLEEIQGGAFLQAFNTLKGGGSITEAEGTKATQAINRMSTAQSEKEFNLAAREYQDVLRNGIARAKAKAAGGGGVPVGRSGSAPAAGGEIDFNSLK